MYRVVDPKEVGRENTWEIFHDSGMPYSTTVVKVDVTNLMEFYKNHRGEYRLNALILYLILNACEPVKETKYNPVGDKIYVYDDSCASCMLPDDEGTLRMCCIPFTKDLDEFQKNYNELTQKCMVEHVDHMSEDKIRIGTRSLGAFNVEIEAVVPAVSKRYNNPFFVFGRIVSEGDKKFLRISMNSHHIAMDGEHVCMIFQNLQELINKLK